MPIEINGMIGIINISDTVSIHNISYTYLPMTQSVVNITEAKKHLGMIAEEAHYLGKPFLLKRGGKPLAAVIGSGVFNRVLELVEAYDPGLADTLALMADPDLQELLQEGEEAIQKGEMVPFTKSLPMEE